MYSFFTKENSRGKYQNLHLNFIGGKWKDGKSDNKIVDYNPFTGDEIATFKAASIKDIDEAYKIAEKVQPKWEERNPYEVSSIMNKAVQIMKDRYEEIINIIVSETGSTRIKASVELGSCIGATSKTSDFPFKMETIVSKSIIPGKTNYTDIRQNYSIFGSIESSKAINWMESFSLFPTAMNSLIGY